MERDTESGADAKRKSKTHLLLFLIFGGLIVGFIALMFFIDYYGERQEAVTAAHDAAEQ